MLSEAEVAVLGLRAHDIVEGRRADLERALSNLLIAPPAGVEARVEIGHPAAALIAAAEGPRPALLAAGRRGVGLMRQMLLGSVSTKLLHNAPGAVLVTPRGMTAGASGYGDD